MNNGNQYYAHLVRLLSHLRRAMRIAQQVAKERRDQNVQSKKKPFYKKSA